MRELLMQYRFGWAALAFAAAALLPVSTSGGLSASTACGSTFSTCCEIDNSACAGSGAGQGWYDTGACGPCSALYECPQ